MHTNEIPEIKGLFLPKKTGTIAKITSCTENLVDGNLLHNSGYPVPFSVLHNHEWFKVGDQVFYFKNWCFGI